MSGQVSNLGGSIVRLDTRNLRIHLKDLARTLPLCTNSQHGMVLLIQEKQCILNMYCNVNIFRA